MDNGDANPVLRYLRALFDEHKLTELSDGQLLDQFIACREGPALEVLVRRHGPMVWGVCRRLLHDHHDAEDAFQAAFLVLARRAASIWPREKVGNWLYGVAYQTARKARATRAKRRKREVANPLALEQQAMPSIPKHNLAEVLDEELSRLPDKYRSPVVLCELEGKTHAEAAERLGWPIGTVSGRLSRARALLAKRLVRRGAPVAGGVLTALLHPGQATAQAGVPVSLLSSTIKAATLYSTPQAATAVSAGAATLAKEVLRTMFISRIKITTVALLVMTCASAGLWQARTWANAKVTEDKKFHVTVNEGFRDATTLVTVIDIESEPGTTIEVVADKSKENATSFSSSGSNATKQASGRNRLRMIVIGDLWEGKEKGMKTVRFQMSQRSGSISSSSSESMQVPAGSGKLEDLLSVAIKSGDYKYGEATKLMKFKDTTYNLVVGPTKATEDEPE